VHIGAQATADEDPKHSAGKRIADAYRRCPQTGNELAGLDASTLALIDDEPW
jgi:hypothetical protein